MTARTEDIYYMVFGGGGSRGVAYAAALYEFQKILNYDFTCLRGAAGSSVGALYAGALCADISPKNILDIAVQSNLIDLVNLDVTNVLSSWSLDTGQRLTQWIDNLLGNQQVTFKQLYAKTNKLLKVTITNLNKNQCEVVDHETHPDMVVAEGIAASMAIPFIFPPRKINGSYYVDGGLTNNYPIDLFPIEQTIGFRVSWGYMADITGFETYLSRLTYCALANAEKCFVDALGDDHKNKSIIIDCGDVCTMNWRLTPQTLQSVITAGKNAVRDFILTQNMRAINLQQRSVGCQTETCEE